MELKKHIIYANHGLKHPFFNRPTEKFNIQNTSKVRSSDGLWLHCLGVLTRDSHHLINDRKCKKHFLLTPHKCGNKSQR